MRLSVVRFWLPAVVTAAGTVVMIAGLARGDDNWAQGGALIVSAGLSIWLLNILYRMSVQGDRERDAEDDARAYFDRYGRWPDDEPPPGVEAPPTAAEVLPAGAQAPPPRRPLPAHRGQAHPRPRRRG